MNTCLLWLTLWGGIPESADPLLRATANVDENPTDAEAVAALAEQIQAFESAPDLVVNDLELSNELLRARLVFAWALFDDGQALDEQPEARDAIDEVIRTAAGRQLPLEADIEPGFKLALKQRATALAEGAGGTIAVSCDRCQLIINELRHPNPTYELPLGRYRVWVLGDEESDVRVHEVVVLESPGQEVTLTLQASPMPNPTGAPPLLLHPPPITARQPPLVDVPRAAKPNPTPQRRLLPLWAESLGMVAGAGLMITGGGLLAIDGHCQDNGDIATCPVHIENTPQGIGLVAGGAGLLAAFAGVLIADQVRLSRKGRSAKLAIEAGVLRF